LTSETNSSSLNQVPSLSSSVLTLLFHRLD